MAKEESEVTDVTIRKRPDALLADAAPKLLAALMQLADEADFIDMNVLQKRQCNPNGYRLLKNVQYARSIIQEAAYATARSAADAERKRKDTMPEYKAARHIGWVSQLGSDEFIQQCGAENVIKAAKLLGYDEQ